MCYSAYCLLREYLIKELAKICNWYWQGSCASSNWVEKWSMPGIDFGQLLNQTLPMSSPPFFLFIAHLLISVRPICILSQKDRKEDARFFLLFLQREVSRQEQQRSREHLRCGTNDAEQIAQVWDLLPLQYHPNSFHSKLVSHQVKGSLTITHYGWSDSWQSRICC